LEASLIRLATDYLDVFLLHSPAATDLGREGLALADTMEGFVQAGKTRFWGVSCDDLACLEAALGMGGNPAVLQVPLRLACSNAAASGCCSEN
jgi:diketogulonate reductase-like aldo/keto reductase